MHSPQCSERNEHLNKTCRNKKVKLEKNALDKFVEIFDFDENVGEKSEFQKL